MGNFEKLGILVIIVLVVVILVLAVWGMGVPPDPQDGNNVISAHNARADGIGGIAAKEEPKTVPIGNGNPAKGPDDRLDKWLDPEPAKEPAVKGAGKTEPGPKAEPATAAADREHKIVKGDSPWAIAERYYGNGTRWTLIRDANPGVNMDNLPVGRVIRIPNADKVAAKKSAPRRETPTRESAAAKKTYTVKKGDNLSGIARRTMGSEDEWRKLYEANRAAIGPNPNDLKLGMELVIP